MHFEIIKKLLSEQAQGSNVFKRNLVKEYLQVVLLSYIYSRSEYQGLIFYGGSCLRHCFDIERLSEDMDFVDLTNSIDLQKMSADLLSFLNKELGVKAISKIQMFRVYLKIPILKGIGLSNASESDQLFIKVEVYKKFKTVPTCQIQTVPVFKFGRSLLVKTFDLSTLMSTKITAVLSRKWKKVLKGGKTVCHVKGRDYFDLMWYLKKGVKPNLEYLGLENMEELKARLLANINNLEEGSIKIDLEGFISDRVFVENLGENIKQILTSQIEKL